MSLDRGDPNFPNGLHLSGGHYQLPYPSSDLRYKKKLCARGYTNAMEHVCTCVYMYVIEYARVCVEYSVASLAIAEPPSNLLFAQWPVCGYTGATGVAFGITTLVVRTYFCVLGFIFFLYFLF